MKKKIKKQKSGHNKGKKYKKPLSLHGMKFEDVIRIALETKPQKT
ncbi:MAG TPA: hypothetical protein PKI31_14295 [Spirochaetota bacterium]|nr:hypothetical protein [Spirochaetota bacterium]